ncbi:AAA family ATPase [Candidatus Woesearchaeota archaeon]|nr:AAA family ATPase [Candidatus Woesearchaeota archaeon]
MIIGITGKNASGKGEAASYLKAKGFVYYSLSDELREEATKKGLSHERETLISLGNILRKQNGPEYLAKRINEKIKNELKKNKSVNFIVDSIRSPYEARELLKNRDFLLLGIDAPVGMRFERLLKRGRAGDSKTLEEFKEHEEKENTKSKNSQQLDETLKLAGKIIKNEGSLGELYEKIDELLGELSKVKL